MHPPSPYNQICPYPAISYGSKVYLSKRKEDGSFLVIKQIPVDEMGVDERKASQTEVDVLAMLKHPNIIAYFDSFMQDKSMMIVMEYAPGTLLEMGAVVIVCSGMVEAPLSI